MLSLNKILLLFSFCLLQIQFVSAQDYEWWNNKHNWDGITPWQDYITTSPKFMGPNALPVPQIKNGTLSKQPYFQIGAEQHRAQGDNTSNLYSKFYTTLFSPRVAFSADVIPIEYYKTDSITRDIRRARNKNAEVSRGDFYFGTYIQLIEDHHKLPDVLLSINFKTASGGNLANARNPDAPGYFFDLSFGKVIDAFKEQKISIKPHRMIGFYVWQLQGSHQQQNDAFLYGLGFDLIFPKLDITNSFGGYYGYLGNGDRPNLYRLTFKSKLDSILNYELRLQTGIHDIAYSSIRFSCLINLEEVLKNTALKF